MKEYSFTVNYASVLDIPHSIETKLQTISGGKQILVIVKILQKRLREKAISLGTKTIVVKPSELLINQTINKFAGSNVPEPELTTWRTNLKLSKEKMGLRDE